MKTVLTWLGWLVAFIFLKIARDAGVPWGISLGVVFGVMVLWMLTSWVFRKLLGSGSGA